MCCNRVNSNLSLRLIVALRMAPSDEALRLVTPRNYSLEQCLEFLADDELLECTPKSLRIRKRTLDHSQRMRELMKKRAGQE